MTTVPVKCATCPATFRLSPKLAFYVLELTCAACQKKKEPEHGVAHGPHPKTRTDQTEQKGTGELEMIISYDSSTEKRYPVAPEGLHPAVCVDLVDLGMKDTKYGAKHKLRLIWQIEELDPDTGRRLTASQMYTASMHPESSLSKALESWRGRKFTDDERKKFDPEVLVGMACQIQITHAPGSEGKVYANVSAVVPLGKGMVAPRAVDYVRVQDRPAKDSPYSPKAAVPTDDDTPF